MNELWAVMGGFSDTLSYIFLLVFNLVETVFHLVSKALFTLCFISDFKSALTDKWTLSAASLAGIPVCDGTQKKTTRLLFLVLIWIQVAARTLTHRRYQASASRSPQIPRRVHFYWLKKKYATKNKCIFLSHKQIQLFFKYLFRLNFLIHLL